MQSAISLILDTNSFEYSLKSQNSLYSNSVDLNFAERTSSSCFFSSSVINLSPLVEFVFLYNLQEFGLDKNLIFL